MAHNYSCEERRVIAQNVRAIRERMGLSRKELGDKIHKTQQTIWEIEQGGSFSRGVLLSVASALGVAESDLLAGIRPEDDQKISVVREPMAIYGARRLTEAAELREVIKDMHAVAARAEKLLERLESKGL